MNSEELFGLIVRVIAFLMVLIGGFSYFFYRTLSSMLEVTHREIPTIGIWMFLVGLTLLRLAPWLVKYSYPKRSAS